MNFNDPLLEQYLRLKLNWQQTLSGFLDFSAFTFPLLYLIGCLAVSIWYTPYCSRRWLNSINKLLLTGNEEECICMWMSIFFYSWVLMQCWDNVPRITSKLIRNHYWLLDLECWKWGITIKEKVQVVREVGTEHEPGWMTQSYLLREFISNLMSFWLPRRSI